MLLYVIVRVWTYIHIYIYTMYVCIEQVWCRWRTDQGLRLLTHYVKFKPSSDTLSPLYILSASSVSLFVLGFSPFVLYYRGKGRGTSKVVKVTDLLRSVRSIRHTQIFSPKSWVVTDPFTDTKTYLTCVSCGFYCTRPPTPCSLFCSHSFMCRKMKRCPRVTSVRVRL